jgi:hypothetical protein
LEDGERVEADNGYRGEPLFISIKDNYRNERHQRAKNVARACHECINRFFKRFEVLHEIFRHDLENRAICFWAVAAITQLSIVLDHTQVWQVHYEAAETFADNLLETYNHAVGAEEVAEEVAEEM